MEIQSFCKVNLVLNILGKRPDGFHELETLMHPVPLTDVLRFEHGANGIELSCSAPSLPTGPENLVHRAATAFLSHSGIGTGVRIHLEKRIPLAAGLGGGSGNAAATLQGLNELFGSPANHETLVKLAAQLGSDVPFFLQQNPALATGRGENVVSLEPFLSLAGCAFILVHPGFGISTPWAYQNLARFPAALNGTPGRAMQVAELLRKGDLSGAGAALYNSLEAPALDKYPLLTVFQEFFRKAGVLGALMSGSGSTTFALVQSVQQASRIAESFRREFGQSFWLRVVPVRS